MPRASDLFIDTCGWGYHLDRKDQLHSQVEALLREAITGGQKLVTTNYIIHELVALLTRPIKLPRDKVLAAINNIKSDFSVEIIHIDQATDNQAWKLLEARPDKQWSLVDASSIIVMKRFGMIRVLSTDECFPTEGLMRLLVGRSTL